MQFLITAYDGTDAKALDRRMAVREAHIALCDKLSASGNMLFGMALLDDSGKMIGSTMIADFPSRADLDAWLKIEPYVTGGVWEKVEVRPCRVGPTFSRK